MILLGGPMSTVLPPSDSWRADAFVPGYPHHAGRRQGVSAGQIRVSRYTPLKSLK
jgi:hypothetical protein